MTIQQLEYIVAVDTYRHFSKAADACFVTQPTLSMMIHKLEDELDVKIFDRNIQPVIPTQIGIQIIAQAKEILKQSAKIKEIINVNKNEAVGEFRLGIIPTVAPYLLPKFVPEFIGKYPKVELKIIELTTNGILEELKTQHIDGGILATPLSEESIKEHTLYYEKFYPYISPNEAVYQKEEISQRDINPEKLWLLEDGHCFKSQIIRFCDIKKTYDKEREGRFSYEAGSIETLMNFVEQGNGLTIIPELAFNQLHPWRKKFVRQFSSPVPVREISLITLNDCVKHTLVNLIATEVQKTIPASMLDPTLKRFVVDVR